MEDWIERSAGAVSRRDRGDDIKPADVIDHGQCVSSIFVLVIVDADAA